MLAPIRMAWRRRAPQRLQVGLALCRRNLHDRLTGLANDIIEPAQSPQAVCLANQVIHLSQPIRKTPCWQGKAENLRIAAQRLNRINMPPGRVLSFWRAVGAPSEQNGFRLCQISGLLYEIGLRAGLQIVERQAHTQDLYTDETRFTALGLDATVVWDHKDVRLRNDTGQLLAISFEVTAEEIRATLWSERPMALARVTIEIEAGNQRGRRVSVFRNTGSRPVRVSSDFYRGSRVVIAHRVASNRHPRESGSPVSRSAAESERERETIP
jgi:vancomycin resistance protein VanW